MINEKNTNSISPKALGENNVHWEEIEDKPEKFIPVEHSHDTAWSDVIGKPSEFAPEPHTHDEYAKRYHRHTLADIIGIDKIKDNSGDGGGDHDHDDRYYTKNQTDSKISNTQKNLQAQINTKAEKTHKHNVAELEGLESILDFYKQYIVSIDTLEEDEDGFFTYILPHEFNTKKLDVKVYNFDRKELLVDIAFTDNNNIFILTDVRENLLVLVKKINTI